MHKRSQRLQLHSVLCSYARRLLLGSLLLSSAVLQGAFEQSPLKRSFAGGWFGMQHCQLGLPA